MLLKYELIRASVKSIILKYFGKDLISSILAKLFNKYLKLENFVQIAKKTIVAKVKANL